MMVLIVLMVMLMKTIMNDDHAQNELEQDLCD